MRHALFLSLLAFSFCAQAQNPPQPSVQVGLRTYIEDQWQFTGNFELGQTQIRGRRGEPGIQMLFSTAESQQRLDRALEAYVAPEVALNDFGVRIHAEGLRLHWTVAAREPLKSFAVQRTTKDGAWQAIGEIPALTTRGLSEFEFVDNDTWNGLASYRLEQVKSSGETAVSQSITAGRCEQGIFAVLRYPDPVLFGASLFLELRKPSRVRITLLNELKEPVGTIYSALTSIGDHEIDLSLDQLPDGEYHCRIEIGTFVSEDIPLH
jgi:hypothetical protein